MISYLYIRQEQPGTTDDAFRTPLRSLPGSTPFDFQARRRLHSRQSACRGGLGALVPVRRSNIVRTTLPTDLALSEGITRLRELARVVLEDAAILVALVRWLAERARLLTAYLVLLRSGSNSIAVSSVPLPLQAVTATSRTRPQSRGRPAAPRDASDHVLPSSPTRLPRKLTLYLHDGSPPKRPRRSSQPGRSQWIPLASDTPTNDSRSTATDSESPTASRLAVTTVSHGHVDVDTSPPRAVRLAAGEASPRPRDAKLATRSE